MKYQIGIDEVGRGPIAGPVAVGAFVFLKNGAAKLFKGVKESKQLSEAKRELWFARIEEAREKGLIDFQVCLESANNIDKKGLSWAIKNCLTKALLALTIAPIKARVLLDGGLKAPALYKNQKTIIKGDEKEIVIALASICAKVTRDRLMNRLVKTFPAYGFEKHKGYGTREHYEALKKYGLTKYHRKSFLKNLKLKLKK